MTQQRLTGQTAWISGGASGIGAATARLFAQEGARVTIADVQTERGQALAAAIQAEGGAARFDPCDVSQETAVETSLAHCVTAYGGLQIIVNCAGVVHVAQLHEYSEREWDALMGVNLKSIFFSIKHGIAYLRRNPRSYMVNIGSVGGFTAQANTPAYNTSKHAVLGLSRAIALDYAVGGLRCNCVCPGITDTPMLRYHLSTTPDPEATLAQRLRRVPMGVALTPEQIARTVLYLSCEDSAGVTGAALVVDGGYTVAAEWETTTPTQFMPKE